MEGSKRKREAAELNGAGPRLGAGFCYWLCGPRTLLLLQVGLKNMKIGEAPNFMIIIFLELNIGANHGNVLNFLY